MISIIAAIGRNRELGKNNKLLWHIPEDLKRFKKLTLGHSIVMGRKTFESIGKPLPGRTNIIVSRSLARGDLARLTPDMEKVIIVKSLEEAIEVAKQEELKNLPVIASEAKQSNSPKIAAVANRSFAMTKGEIFIIGGGQIYKQALPLADKLYLTIVDSEFEADTFFPNYSEFKKVVSEEKGDFGDYKYTFLELKR